MKYSKLLTTSIPYLWKIYFFKKVNARIRPNDIIVKTNNTATYGDKSLTALGLKTWNSLREKVTSESSGLVSKVTAPIVNTLQEIPRCYQLKQNFQTSKVICIIKLSLCRTKLTFLGGVGRRGIGIRWVKLFLILIYIWIFFSRTWSVF